MNVKTKLNIVWPTTHFTIQDIQEMHPDAKNITLRFRINKAAENNDIVYIGKNPTNVGRPTIVFAPYPVEDDVLQDAVSKGVILDEKFSSRTQVTTVATVAKTESVEVKDASPAEADPSVTEETSVATTQEATI